MGQHGALIIIGLIAGGIVIGIITYYVLRFLKGSIKLDLPVTSYNGGDVITGSFQLQTKKPVEGNRLVVSLIGTKITRSRHNGKTRTHSEEFYRDDVVLEDAKHYRAGTVERHDFELATPDMQQSEFMNSGLGKALATAAKFLGGHSTRFKWKVEARLDAKGVDLAASKKIKLNVQGMF